LPLSSASIYLRRVDIPRASFLAALLILASGCGSQSAGASSGGDPTASWKPGTGPAVPVSGKAFLFGPSANLSLEGATISVAEAPDQTTTVAADGTFSFMVPSGAPLSFHLDQTMFFPNQSATLDVGPSGIEELGFQAPTEDTAGLLATFAHITIDPTMCQISTTVSKAGTAPYGGSGLGEPDAVVSISPAPPDGGTPIYFQYLSETTILPDPTLTATSIDGGVIFANVPPGDYTLTATKQGIDFTPVHVRCRAGVLVNAAPPHGIQEM
jgi:hypothetical protein